jgi:LysR family transcriptional regulator, chromosome initiation inhibitor
MLAYHCLEALAVVVREGNFARAARALRITQPAISQRIKLLEEQAGQPLLVRSTPPTPTKHGRLLIQHLERVRALEGELDDAFEEAGEPYVTIPIGVNSDTLATWLAPALKQVLRDTKTLVEIIVDDEFYSRERLRRSEVIGCIAADQTPPQGCDADYLGTMRYRCVCTPKFFKKFFPSGFERRALANVPAINFNRKDSMLTRYLQREFSWNSAYPCHLVPSTEIYLQFILDGHGYGLISDLQLGTLLERGRLVELAPDSSIDAVYYWHCTRYQTENARKLIDALKVSAAKLVR